jgi:hypothetical protein
MAERMRRAFPALFSVKGRFWRKAAVHQKHLRATGARKAWIVGNRTG